MGFLCQSNVIVAWWCSCKFSMQQWFGYTVYCKCPKIYNIICFTWITVQFQGFQKPDCTGYFLWRSLADMKAKCWIFLQFLTVAALVCLVHTMFLGSWISNSGSMNAPIKMCFTIVHFQIQNYAMLIIFYEKKRQQNVL